MNDERAKDLLMNLLERAMTGERTFLTSREVEALKSLLLKEVGTTGRGIRTGAPTFRSATIEERGRGKRTSLLWTWVALRMKILIR